ncbi:hypothetical protein C5167_030356, partial [Papaver somniferum]
QRLAKKAEARAIFMLGAEEESQSLHNIEDLIDAGEYALSLLRKGEICIVLQISSVYVKCCRRKP